MSRPYMRSSSCRAPLSLSAPATPPPRSVCSNTRGRTLVASHMTQASAPGRRFLKLPEGGFRTVGKISTRTSASDTSVRLRPISPPLAGSWLCPITCNVACVAPCRLRRLRDQSRPEAARVTPPAEPEPPPDPASIDPKPSDIQVGGKQYTKVAGLTWVERESTKPDSFADVSVGPNDLQSKDQPTPLPPKTAEAPKAPKRVVVTGSILRPRTPARAGVHRYGDVAV